MVGRIITARHGRPDVDRTVRISAREYGDWWANYDLAGLAPEESPPEALVKLAENCDIVLSSSLPRAIETAQKIVKSSRDVPQDPVFVEAPLPAPPVPFLKLNPTRWGQISRTFWFLGYAPKGMEGHIHSWKRVKKVADQLISHAATGGDVLLCAHGYLNWMIDEHIRRRGWVRVDHQGRNHYWSWRVYEQQSVDLQVVPTSEVAE